MVTLNEDDEAELDLWAEQSEHIKKLMKTMSGFMKKIQKTKQETDEIVGRLNEINEADGDSGGGFGSGSSDESSSDSSSDAGGGSGDDGLGLDFPGMDDLTDTPPDDASTDDENADDKGNPQKSDSSSATPEEPTA